MSENSINSQASRGRGLDPCPLSLHNVANSTDFPTIRNRGASGLTTQRAQISRALLSLKLVLYGTVMRAQALHRANFDAQRASINPTTRISRPTDDPPGGKLAKRPCALGGLGRPQRGTLSVPGAHPVIPELIGRIQATGTAVSSDGSRLAGHARGC